MEESQATFQWATAQVVPSIQVKKKEWSLLTKYWFE